MAQKIEIEIQTDSPLEARSRKELLQSLANVPIDVLEKIAQLNTQKGIDNLRSKWGMIKMFC